MGKLVRVVVLLGILVVGVVLYMKYAKSGSDAQQPTGGAAIQTAQKKEPAKGKESGMQVQEKYGFAPVGE